MKEVNFEIYTKNPVTGECGWEIMFVSVIAENKEKAIEILKTWSLFDVIILFNYTCELWLKSDGYELTEEVRGQEGDIFDTDSYYNTNQKYEKIVK